MASVVVANSEAEAYELLRAALYAAGLVGDVEFTLEVLPLDTPHAVILNDGDY